MPGKREVRKEYRNGKSKEADSAVTGREDNNSPGNGFSSESMERPYNMNQIRQSRMLEESRADELAAPEQTELEVPASFGAEEEVGFDSKFNLEDLNYEIEDILAELEQLKAKVIPIMDRRDLKQEMVLPLASGTEPPAVPFAPQPAVVSSDASAKDLSVEESDGLDFSQDENDLKGGNKRRILGISILAAAILIGAAGYFYFFRHGIQAPASIVSPKALPTIGETAKTPMALKNTPAQEPSWNESRAAAVVDVPSRSRNDKTELQAESRPEGSSQIATGVSAAKPKPPEPSSPQNSAPESVVSSLNPAIPSRPATPVSDSGNAIPRRQSMVTAPPKNMPGGSQTPSHEQSGTKQPESVMVPTTGLVMAETISRAKPVYPEQAKDQKITGIVELEADINERGEVIRAKAVSGPDQLRGAAEEALMKWKFKPASLNGVNIASKARISMVFNLR